ncbi:hypothetical protein M8C21_021328 [Ambrosia artemisiifolia]|uniref:Uncharacterized protein n=1 Tax=Ambrosia artemisiifolia TaxID=4212 RepID=A0AAD5CH39_AMBAR|nr:hypothetical protein M8C21_021328 [Ambrosia artemisiifolia]
MLWRIPFIACEIFTCEVDIILKALVEDDESMNLLFSFLDPEHLHSTQLAGYFSYCMPAIAKDSSLNELFSGGEANLTLVDIVIEGGAVVLTLKDQNVLADGDINEGVDMLENVEIGEQKRRNEAY